ncbi:MAG: PKD domain-containing protein [Vicinamibacterales bacterium]
MAKAYFPLTAALAAMVLAAACTAHKTEVPALTGPSGLGTTITIAVSPDALTRDGVSQALVTVAAINANGQPASNVSITLDLRDQSGQVTGALGTLSALNVVTNSSGQATATFRAPCPVGGNGTSICPGIGTAGTGTTIVEIGATPAGSDFGDAVARVAQIELVPQGVIGAPPSSLVPDFTAPTPTIGGAVVFSATVVDSKGNNAINQVAQFNWNFGDGGSATCQTATHTFSALGTFPVTLAISDVQGDTAFVTHSVTVGQGQVPTATFNFSPASPNVNQAINFNASASQAAAGHTITVFAWNFGDGTLGSDALATHSYPQAGTYTVTLKVTDDLGRKSTLTSQRVSVGLGAPAAAFTFAPSSPRTAQSVAFDASSSQAETGRSIVSYSWNFDDGATAAGVQATHSYSTAGTYNVILTVTDSVGQTGSVTHAVNVSNGNPTAVFTFSPTQPIFGVQVNFDGTASTATSGKTISSYAWAWGDGSAPGSGATTTHAFAAAGTYVVKLTVTDSAGLTGSSTQSITVGNGDPTASFIVNPSSPTHGSPATLDASGSSAAQGRTITNYAWIFGDGNSTSTGNSSTSHTYLVAGTYSVTLTVTDSQGRTNSVTQSVVVQ